MKLSSVLNVMKPSYWLELRDASGALNVDSSLTVTVSDPSPDPELEGLTHYYVVSPSYERMEPIDDWGLGPTYDTCDIVEIEAKSKRDAVILGVRHMLKYYTFKYVHDQRSDRACPYTGIRAFTKAEWEGTDQCWKTVDGVGCVNCGKVLTQHLDQMYCQREGNAEANS